MIHKDRFPVKNSPNAVVFDIDGTLAENIHHIISTRHGKENWRKFYDKTIDDKVIEPTANIMRQYYWTSPYNVLICTGRPEYTRMVTEDWLNKHSLYHNGLYMVPDGIWKPDYITKAKLADKILNKYDVLFVFDDKPSVIDMWRNKGVYVFQCKGDVD